MLRVCLGQSKQLDERHLDCLAEKPTNGATIYRFPSTSLLIEKEGGSLLVNRYPLRLLRCNLALTTLLNGVKKGRDTAVSRTTSSTLERLADLGFLRRVWQTGPLEDAAMSVSIIIPVKDRAEELRCCLESLKNLSYPGDKLEVIVVDDGSSDRTTTVAKQWGARTIPSGGVGLGPAAARNRGAHAATGEILAFLDSDCTASPDWLTQLIAPFADKRVAAVGGEVRGLRNGSFLDRYEDAMSSLCLGRHEKWSSAEKDAFYLPSCNMLVRRTHFSSVGGFNETMHVGEDVDLSYRLRDAGYRIGYLPVGHIFHAHRNRILSFMNRRFAYGTSEGILMEKHPARKKHMNIPPLSMGVVLAIALIPLLPVAAAILSAVLLSADIVLQNNKLKKFDFQQGWKELLLGKTRSVFALGYYLSYHLIRYYSVPILAASCLHPILGGLAVAVFLWAAAVEYAVKKPGLAFPLFCGIFLLEQLAYGSGVFRGCLGRGNFYAYYVQTQSQSTKASGRIS